MNLTRRSTLRMALAMLFIIAAYIAASGRAAATSCPYTVSIFGSAAPPCMGDFPMSVTAIYNSGAWTKSNTYFALGNFTEQAPGAGGMSITDVTVNGITVAASATGVRIPSSCLGRFLEISVGGGPNGCPWIYITWV